MRVILTGNTSFKIANFRAGILKALLRRGIRVFVLVPDFEHANELQSLGCEVVYISMSRHGQNPVRELATFFSLLYSIWRIRPNILFSFTIKNNIYSGIACRVLKVAFVPNVTGLGPVFDTPAWKQRLICALYRSAFFRAKKIFFQNPDDMQVFAERRIASTKRAVLLPGSGVDLQHYSPQPTKRRGEEVRFLFLGRILREKGVELLAGVAADVAKRHPNATFHLVGPLDQGGLSLDEVEGWSSFANFHYLGPTRDVRPHLEDCDCVVLPSYYREGTPRSLLEACACSKPIITTDIPGCRDAVRDGINGYLIPPRDRRALANAVSKFVELDESRKAKMGEESRRLAVAKFSEEVVIGRYLECLPLL